MGIERTKPTESTEFASDGEEGADGAGVAPAPATEAQAGGRATETGAVAGAEGGERDLRVG